LGLTHNEELSRGELRVDAFELNITRSTDASSARHGIPSGTCGLGAGAVETALIPTRIPARRTGLDAFQTGLRWFPINTSSSNCNGDRAECKCCYSVLFHDLFLVDKLKFAAIGSFFYLYGFIVAYLLNV
jgi:hypothetical protein